MKGLMVLLRSRRGSTLVELIVAMSLFSLLLLMVSGALHPAAAVTRRIQVLDESQRLLDSVLEVIRMEAERSCGYIKLYENGADPAGQEGTLTAGNALEYLDADGCPVFLSAEGCDAAWLAETQEAAELPPGRLFFLTREDKAEICAKTCREPYGDAYYGGMYLGLEFAPEEEALEGEREEALVVTASFYRDAERRELVRSESLVVELRNAPRWTTAVTAVK